MDNGAWTFWGVVVICITVLSIVATVTCYRLDKVYIEHGYTKGTIQGSGCRTWMKGE